MAASNDEPIDDHSTRYKIVLAELVEIEHGQRLLAPFTVRKENEPFGVPSRFGIGTLLVVTAAYGALLALLRALDWDARLIAWIIVFISLVGAGQMLLFGSRRPRHASLLTGAVALPAIVVTAAILHSGRRGPPSDIGCGLVAAMIFGAPAGYLAGGVVAGVFLIMDAVQRGLTRMFPPTTTTANDDDACDNIC